MCTMRSKESPVIWGGGVLVQTFRAHPLSLRGLGLYIHEPNHVFTWSWTQPAGKQWEIGN